MEAILNGTLTKFAVISEANVNESLVAAARELLKKYSKQNSLTGMSLGWFVEAAYAEEQGFEIVQTFEATSPRYVWQRPREKGLSQFDKRGKAQSEKSSLIIFLHANMNVERADFHIHTWCKNLHLRMTKFGYCHKLSDG